MKRLLICCLFSLYFCLTGCGKREHSQDESIETEKITFTKEGKLSFMQNDTLLKAIDIEVARNSYEHQTGLMYRESMQEDRGMLFVYNDERPRPGFYMKNTEFNLDLVYINAAHEIVDFNRNAKAFDETPLPSDKPAQYVVEINAGKINDWNLKLGNTVEINLDES